MSTKLSSLHIHQLRNITLAQLSLHSKMNLFYGPNGSGKTSLLEAIYLLSNGRSFRTRETSPLIQNDQNNLTLFSRTFEQETFSLQKTKAGATRVQINQEPCLRSSELARLLPSQLVYQDLFQIIDAGPSFRRSILDWGMFHVKHSYHGLWKDYKHALKQRNALLRQKTLLQQMGPWDSLLEELSYQLDALRAEYVDALIPLFQMYLAELTDTPCSIRYYKGWDKKQTGISLGNILKEQFSLDCQRQFTHSGAHQADIIIESQTNRAKTVLSRGQQKMVLIALKLAQAKLLMKPCLYLIDDISSELDSAHVQRLTNCIAKIDGQFFITTHSLDSLRSSAIGNELRVFEVCNGVFVDAH